MTGIQTTLGERVRSRRWDDFRLFQEDVAKDARISASFLSEIESDRTRVTKPTLRRLATALRLDPIDLIAHAQREWQIGARSSRTTDDGPESVVPPQARFVPAQTRTAPDYAWLTADEAADAIGCTAGTLRHLLRTGVLAPAKQVQINGRGHACWLVARSSVLAYVPRNEGRAFSRGVRGDPPQGYLSIDEYVEESGIPRATLYRRIKAGEIETITVNGRRWVKDA